MENVITNTRKAGVWVRFAAISLDLIITWLAVKLIVAVFIHAGVYIPFELTFILFFLAYSVSLIGWRAATIGKTFCGLTVQSSKGRPAGYLRALLRETVCKFISAVFLFLGFIWAGFSRKKCAWHDYIAGTMVIQNPQLRKRTPIALLAVFVVMVFFIGRKPLINIWLCYRASRRMGVPSNISMPYTERDPSSLVETSSFTEDDYTKFIEWLDLHGRDPVEYAVETAAKHQVTIFGEIHQQRDYLAFLNQIIPELYHRAGVTCVAMEVCLAVDNERINRLVTAPKFDRELALEIARHQSWGIWGFKGYWDVFETVWRLNKSLPEGKKKMRLIGIDAKFDGPSMALVTGGEGAKIKAPIWEKLRIFRILDEILLLVKRDELMALNIEKEIIERGERGIVWVGLNHSYTHYQQPIILRGKLVRKFSRMGVMLYHKYGDKIFQVALHEGHGVFDSVMKKLIKPVMKERGSAPVGFDVAESPFSNLRDSGSKDYRCFAGLRFADKAAGYIYLKPAKKLKKCEWLPGYVSKKMFVANMPYYKAWAQLADKQVSNEREVNEVLKTLLEN